MKNTSTLSKFKSFIIENGKRILKVNQYGAKTAKESYPFGFDSAPLKDFTAIYMETSNADESVIVGYINKNQTAALGESRMYALGSSGEVVGFVWAKADGKLLLNGDAFSSVRYENLNTELQNQITAINNQFNAVSASIANLGGVFTPVPTVLNLDSVKSETVKIK